MALNTITRSSLISSIGSLTPGDYYQITDRSNITLMALTTSSLATSGTAIFLNTDYQIVGDYSLWGSQLGLWDSSLMPVVNDIVIWDGNHYSCSTGVNGASDPSVDITNWSLLSKDTSNGYIEEVCDVSYSLMADVFLKRADTRGNEIKATELTISDIGVNPIDVFQWGNDMVQENKITDACVYCINNAGVVARNKVSSLGSISANGNKGDVVLNEVSNVAQLIATGNKGNISSNLVRNIGSSLSAVDNEGVVDGHYIFQGSLNVDGQYLTGKVRGCILNHGSVINATNNSGEIGAAFMTVGSTGEFSNNEGHIQWLYLSNTTVLDCSGNKGNVKRIIQNGPYTLTCSMDAGRELLFLDAQINKDYTVDGTVDHSYKELRWYNLQ